MEEKAIEAERKRILDIINFLQEQDYKDWKIHGLSEDSVNVLKKELQEVK